MSDLHSEVVRKPLELTAEQVTIIREVLERNHAYYMRHYGMPKPCMWPEELVTEIANTLLHASTQSAGLPRLQSSFLDVDKT